MPSADDIDEDLAGFDGDDDRWDTIDDDVPVDEPADQTAVWRLMRWLRRDEKKIAEYESYRDNEIARIRSFTDDRTAGLRRHVEALRRTIENWQRATETKTVKTPYYTGRLTPPRARVVVFDGDAFEAWARGNHREDLLKETVEPIRSEIAKLLAGAPAPSSTLPAEDLLAQRTAVHVLEPLPDDAPPDQLPSVVPGVVFSVGGDPSYSLKPVDVTPPEQTGSNPKETQ